MRILSWNVAFGRGTKAAIELADRVAADIVLLQEASRPPRWGTARLGCEVAGRKWGSWILVRDGKLKAIPVDTFEGWVCAAEWRRATGSVVVASLHSPTSNKSHPRKSYVEEASRAVAAIHGASSAARSCVIGGDFNFKLFGPSKASQLKGAAKREVDATLAFKKLGFANAWADSHAGAPLPQTLRWSKDKTVPYHCDGLLVRPFVADRAVCEVLSSEFITRHSDHNALFAEFD